MGRLAHALRCLLQLHRWRRLDGQDDAGWECRDCGEAVLDADVRRERIERVHDGSGQGTAASIAGAGAASSPPF